MAVIGTDFEGICRKSDDFAGTSAEVVSEIYKRHCRYPLHFAVEKGRLDLPGYLLVIGWVLMILNTIRSDVIFNLLVSIPPIDPNSRDGKDRLPLRIALQQRDGIKVTDVIL